MEIVNAKKNGGIGNMFRRFFQKSWLKQNPRDLRNRWVGEEFRVMSIINDIRSGEDWTKHLLKSEENGWKELPFLSTCPSKFKIPGDAAPRDLRGLEFRNIDLSNTTGLSNSCMDFCRFKGTLFDSASLIGASLLHVKMNDDCVLNRADLQYSDLRYSEFKGVSFEDAILIRADLRGTNFRDAILVGVKLKHFKYSEEPWWGFIIPNKWTRFGGEFQSQNLLDSEISLLDAKFIEGENLRWLFGHKYRILSFMWYIFGNYGRSPSRLLFWIFIIWVFFGFCYASYTLPSCIEGTTLGNILCLLAPKIDWKDIPPNKCFFRPYYFSAVTMTTLGFGDILPNPVDWKAQLYICVQVLLGYFILGIFIGILIQNFNNITGSKILKTTNKRSKF